MQVLGRRRFRSVYGRSGPQLWSAMRNAMVARGMLTPGWRERAARAAAFRARLRALARAGRAAMRNRVRYRDVVNREIYGRRRRWY